MLRVAIYSCVARTRLRPVVLHDSRMPPEMLSWMHGNGVETIEHEVSFANSLRRHFEGWELDWALGSYMRCDIPRLFAGEEKVLYTDTDVMFKKNHVGMLESDLNGIPLGLCREVGPVRGGYCISNSMRNTGVILFNARWFRENSVDFEAFGNERKWKFSHDGENIFDQGLLNDFFPSGTYQLPAEFNCRAYQGKNSKHIIEHYHMFKPLKSNEQFTDYQIKTSYHTDQTVRSVLDFAGDNIRKSVREFRKTDAISKNLIIPESKATSPFSL